MDPSIYFIVDGFHVRSPVGSDFDYGNDIIVVLFTDTRFEGNGLQGLSVHDAMLGMQNVIFENNLTRLVIPDDNWAQLYYSSEFPRKSEVADVKFKYKGNADFYSPAPNMLTAPAFCRDNGTWRLHYKLQGNGTVVFSNNGLNPDGVNRSETAQ